MPVSRTIGPSASGGDGQLIGGGAVGARPGPRPGVCCPKASVAARRETPIEYRIGDIIPLIEWFDFDYRCAVVVADPQRGVLRRIIHEHSANISGTRKLIFDHL